MALFRKFWQKDQVASGEESSEFKYGGAGSSERPNLEQVRTQVAVQEREAVNAEAQKYAMQIEVNLNPEKLSAEVKGRTSTSPAGSLEAYQKNFALAKIAVEGGIANIEKNYADRVLNEKDLVAIQKQMRISYDAAVAKNGAVGRYKSEGIKAVVEGSLGQIEGQLAQLQATSRERNALRGFINEQDSLRDEFADARIFVPQGLQDARMPGKTSEGYITNDRGRYIKTSAVNEATFRATDGAVGPGGDIQNAFVPETRQAFSVDTEGKQTLMYEIKNFDLRKPDGTQVKYARKVTYENGVPARDELVEPLG